VPGTAGGGDGVSGQRFARATRAAGLPHVSLHGLRHTFASIAIAEGMPITHVAKLLGHKDPEITLKLQPLVPRRLIKGRDADHRRRHPPRKW
jgi:integrase